LNGSDFSVGADDLGMAALALPDGSIIVGGDSYSADGDTLVRNAGPAHHGCASGHRDFLPLKLSAKGELLWSRSYGGTNHEYLSTGKLTSLSGYGITESLVANGGNTPSVTADMLRQAKTGDSGSP
jgi:hypothetical protein